jgi:hypothetical protein
MLPIQALALSHGCALPGREPFLIGNLPRRLLPRFSARVAPQSGMHVTLTFQKQPTHMTTVHSGLLVGAAS